MFQSPAIPLSMKGTGMPRTANEYQQRWQEMMNPESVTTPFDEGFTPTTCVVYETSRSMPMGGGCSYFPDFGDAICFYRYLRIPEELDIAPAPMDEDTVIRSPHLAPSQWSWSRYRSRFSNGEIRQRRAAGECALDALLDQFVREGYRPAMGQMLIEIVNAALIDFALHEVYVLPDDLSVVLRRFGNPLATRESAWGHSIVGDAGCTLDLTASGHREALAEHLAGISR